MGRFSGQGGMSLSFPRDGGGDVLPRRQGPALSCQGADVACGCAGDREGDVVERWVGIAVGVMPTWIVRHMIRCVPAPLGWIESAHQGCAVVDDQGLLVL